MEFNLQEFYNASQNSSIDLDKKQYAIGLIETSVSLLYKIVEDRLAEPHICAMIQTEIQRLQRVAYFLAKEGTDSKQA